MTRQFIFVVGRVAVAALLCCALLPAPAHAWGNKGHRMVNWLAWQRLPAEMPPFLRAPAVGSQIEYLGPEPDRWRSSAEPELSAAQAPEHYINFETADRIGPLPRERWQFVQQLYAYRVAHPTEAAEMLPQRVGLQPWQATEVEQRLQAAFREWREQHAAHHNTAATEEAIVFYMGWLGHYVADGSQPLHTTVHYSGWKGANPRGYTTDRRFHEQFETQFVDDHIAAEQIAPLVAEPAPLRDVFADYVTYLRASNALVPQTYQLEQRGGFAGGGTPEARKFVAQRLAAAVTELDAMWLTAWRNSAAPVAAFPAK
jgi:hypothetical protein